MELISANNAPYEYDFDWIMLLGEFQIILGDKSYLFQAQACLVSFLSQS